MFYLVYKNFGHMKNCQTLDCKNLALDLKKIHHPYYIQWYNITIYLLNKYTYLYYNVHIVVCRGIIKEYLYCIEIITGENILNSMANEFIFCIF